MTDSMIDLVVQVLQEYEEKTQRSCFIIANDMGIEPSNYYKYRDGEGNPTCRTVDKILEAITAEHPEILEKMLERKLKDVRVIMAHVKNL